MQDSPAEWAASEGVTARLLPVTRFGHCRDNKPAQGRIPWARLAAILTTHTEREQKDGPLWSPTLYREGATRGREGVQSVSCLVADIDKNKDNLLLALEKALYPYEYAAHTTWSFGADNWAFRFALPLAEDVPAERWEEVWARLRLLLVSAGIRPDEACKDPSRIYYLPSCPKGGQHIAWHNPSGVFIRVSDLPQVPKRAPVAMRPMRPVEGIPVGELLERALSRAHSGNRHNMGLWLACQMRDAGLTEDEAAFHMETYWSAVGDAGYPRRELENDLRSAYRRAPRKPLRRPRKPSSLVEAAVNVCAPPSN